MLFRKLAVSLMATAVLAYGPLQASALTLSGPVHTMRSNQLRPPVPPCTGPYTDEWFETSTNPAQYTLEDVGQFCTPMPDYVCPAGDPLYICELIVAGPIHQTGLGPSTKKWLGGGQLCLPCIALPSGPNGSMIVNMGKKSQGVLADFSIGFDAGGSAVADAADGTRQLLYASTPNTSGTAGILVYSGTNTNPTALLTDKQAGPNAGGIAIDRKGNIYWAFDDQAGNGHIDEFAPGGTSERRLNISPKGAAGDLEIDAHGNLVVASPSANSVQIYGVKGTLLTSFTTSGTPNSLCLDAKNQNLYLVDQTNNLIDQYSYPSGSLLASSPPPAINGQVGVAVTVTVANAETE